MSVLGTTGTRSVTREQAEAILELNREYFGTFDSFVTGACKGWDAYAGEWFVRNFPDRKHFVYVPANRSQVDYWWTRRDVQEFVDSHDVYLLLHELADGSTYRHRNVAIVKVSTELFYCAELPEDHGRSQRSGTWQTYRLADKKRIPIAGVILNEK